jgi:hypothetical protein
MYLLLSMPAVAAAAVAAGTADVAIADHMPVLSVVLQLVAILLLLLLLFVMLVAHCC